MTAPTQVEAVRYSSVLSAYSLGNPISCGVLPLRPLLSNLWVRYALTLALIALVLSRVHVGHVLDAAGAVRPSYLVLALALTVPFLYLKALRWFLMLRAASIEADFREALLSLVGGMGLALVTPARLGELIRAAYLRDPQKLRIGGLVLIDKGFDVLALVGLAIPGAWVLLGPAAGLALCLAGLCGLIVVFAPGLVLERLRRVGNRVPLGSKLVRAAESLEALSPGASALFLLLTLASFVVVLAQFGIILLNWRQPTVDLVLLTFPLVILTNVLPLTIGGLGIREGAAAALLSHYGVPAAEAALAAFLMFAINTALPGLAGALLLPAIPGARPRHAGRG